MGCPHRPAAGGVSAEARRPHARDCGPAPDDRPPGLPPHHPAAELAALLDDRVSHLCRSAGLDRERGRTAVRTLRILRVLPGHTLAPGTARHMGDESAGAGRGSCRCRSPVGSPAVGLRRFGRGAVVLAAAAGGGRARGRDGGQRGAGCPDEIGRPRLRAEALRGVRADRTPTGLEPGPDRGVPRARRGGGLDRRRGAAAAVGGRNAFVFPRPQVGSGHAAWVPQPA